MAKKSKTVEEKAASGGKGREAQLAALELIAQFEKPGEVCTALTEQGLMQHVTASWVQKCSSVRCCPRWAKPVIEKFREEFLSELHRIPIRHRAFRLAKLQEIVESTKDDRVRLQALAMAHSQSGDDVQKFEDVGRSSWVEVVEALERADAGDEDDGE